MIEGWKETGSFPLLKTACAHNFQYPIKGELDIGQKIWIDGKLHIHAHGDANLSFKNADALIQCWFRQVIANEHLNPDTTTVLAMHSAYPERDELGTTGYLFRLG